LAKGGNVLKQKITELREKLFTMASIVEEMISKGIRSLVEKNEDLAKEVIEEQEPKVNDLEIEIDEFCINLLALYQPEASNLRTITMIMKINNDLERIGDHAVNIAERALYLIPRPQIKPLIDLPKIAEGSIKMLRDVLDSFTKGDADLAIEVCERDTKIDALRDQIIKELITYVISDPSSMNRALAMILIAKYLERIADLATNIAEDVVYTVKGEIIKHHAKEK